VVVWDRFRNAPLVVPAVACLSLIALIALLAPWIAQDPFEVRQGMQFLPPGADHPFGTDHLGRDLLSQVIWGARTSLTVSVGTLALTLLIAVPVGGVAGYYGGWLDNLLMRILDVFLVIPALFLVITVVAVFGNQLVYLVVILGLVSWPALARVFRGSVLTVRNNEFIVAAQATGCGDARILVRHVVPNAIFPVLVQVPLVAANVILTEASLGFIGLGDPRIVSWGGMLRNAQQMLAYSWWMTIFPAIFVSATILCFQQIGDGLIEALSSRAQNIRRAPTGTPPASP
jgi:peptide/nickel transport system permease protein